jgi:hypothetical protein
MNVTTRRKKLQLRSNEVIPAQLREKEKQERGGKGEANVIEKLPVPQHPEENLTFVNG